MRLLFIAILFFLVASARSQTAVKNSPAKDNATQLNPDGSNKFEAPIGLDLMGGNTKGITIYPSISDDHVLISVLGKSSEKREIVVTTLTGKTVYHTASRSENTFMLDTSGLGKGIYVIRVVSGSKVYTKKWARR